MSAVVSRAPTFGSQAWCEECQDGINGSARKCNIWEYAHNQKHHTPETETTP